MNIKELMRTPFDDGRGRTGVEGWWSVYQDKLIVYVKPTNSAEDWLSAFIAFPVWDSAAHCFVHLGYRNYAHWLQGFIEGLVTDDIREIVMIGYSMGGGVIMETGQMYLSRLVTVVSIDGPRTTSRVTSDCKLYYNRGSLVNKIPFWFRRIQNAVCLVRKWRPFWVSHADYYIDKIIAENI